MRPVVLGIAVVLVFVITLAIVWQLMPYPRRDIDYLVMGGSATMVSMAVLFIALISPSIKSGDAFFRKRKD